MEDFFAGLIQARGDGDWREELTCAIGQAQTELVLCEMDVLQSDMGELQENILWNQYLLEQNIQPKVPPGAGSCGRTGLGNCSGDELGCIGGELPLDRSLCF